jgi:beta-glucosidase
LSYTTFAYSDLVISPDSLGIGDSIEVRCTVRNTGARTGDEVVQLYLRDAVSSVARPVQELRGFRRIALAPGEEAVVRFRVAPEALAMLDRDLRPVIEPGIFDVMIGASSRDIRLRGAAIVR